MSIWYAFRVTSSFRQSTRLGGQKRCHDPRWSFSFTDESSDQQLPEQVQHRTRGHPDPHVSGPNCSPRTAPESRVCTCSTHASQKRPTCPKHAAQERHVHHMVTGVINLRGTTNGFTAEYWQPAKDMFFLKAPGHQHA